MKKQPEVTEATRAALVAAFCEFYRERPVERITVKEVAEKAGYSRATFYKYFSDNFALLDYVEESLIADVLGKADGVMKARFGGSFVTTFVASVEENRAYASVLTGPLGAAHFSAKLRRDAVPRLMAALGVDASNAHARLALEYHVAGLVTLLGTWFAQDGEGDPGDLANLVQGLLRDGVLAQLHTVI